jgi:hypothetical protein
LFEVVYAGEESLLPQTELPDKVRQRARAAGKSVLDFLGAAPDPDATGFYPLWSAASP